MAAFVVCFALCVLSGVPELWRLLMAGMAAVGIWLDDPDRFERVGKRIRACRIFKFIGDYGNRHTQDTSR